LYLPHPNGFAKRHAIESASQSAVIDSNYSSPLGYGFSLTIVLNATIATTFCMAGSQVVEANGDNVAAFALAGELASLAASDFR
jgi:hypothetical protein